MALAYQLRELGARYLAVFLYLRIFEYSYGLKSHLAKTTTSPPQHLVNLPKIPSTNRAGTLAKAMEVMGSAGLKMFLYHPILSLHHLWDARIEPDSSAKVLVF
jgi:hypothetical protein